MTKVLTDPYKNKFINRRVIPTQQIVAHQLTINLANSDKHAQTLTGNDLINYLTEQNQLNANYAQTEFRQLNQQLIQDATKQTSIVHHKNL